MKNLKPSQLPEDTVIDAKNGDYVEGLFIKKADGIWEDLFSGCGCCEDHVRVSDQGCEELETYKRSGRATTSKTSDEYFEDFKVVALPPGYPTHPDRIHGSWSFESHTYSDGTTDHNCKGYNCDE